MKYQTYIENVKNDRMEEVIKSAAQLFMNNGIENIKMTDIAKDCEVGVASLYRYFKTKTAILIRSAIYEWERVNELFDGIFECPTYAEKSGLEQIKELLKLQLVLFISHKNFLRFLYGFDVYMIKEKVDKSELCEYEKSILNIYPYFENAYKKGIDDKTVRTDIDFSLFCKSLSHSLMNLCQKFIIGEILPNDDFSNAEEEIKMMIDMAISYLGKENEKGDTL